jgi:type I restriction enzyme R subunit
MDVFLKKRGVDVQNIIEEKDNFKKIGLVDIAVEKIVENEKSKEEFFNLAGRLKVLLKAVLPDIRAEKYLKQILVISIITQKITEITHSLTPEEREEEKKKIGELSQKVSDLLDSSISIDDYEIKDSKPFDLSQVDFEELKERFFGGDKQKTTLENLKSAVKKKIKELIELNQTRESYSDKFEELINNYNAGDIDAEKFFLELVNLSRSLGEEEARHMRENLTEEELVIFDILTKPEPKLSKKEIEEVKKVAKELLETLKTERLVVDWKKRQSTRAKVVNTIEEVCDKLPGTYESEIFKNKCDNLYVYFYDNYSSSEHRISY